MFFLCFLIAFSLCALIVLLIPMSNDIEKLSSYECGFHSFDDTRHNFNVRFYLISIIFLIFDLEIVYLFPLILNVRLLGFIGFLVIIFFLFVVTVGFFYEWLKGALTWE